MTSVARVLSNRSQDETEPLEDAERLLLEALQPEVEFGAGDLDRLCAEHTHLAPELRAVWEGFATARAALRGTAGADAVDSGRRGELVAGRFRLLGEIGRGGMSIVLLAWDARMRRKLAVKCVRGDANREASAQAALRHRRSRLLHEAQVLAQLDHPGIVPVYDVVQDETGELYVAMLRVRGEDLRAIYRRHWDGDPQWNLARLLGVLLNTCEAVAYAHGKAVLHRDLKPANVMVGAFGETYVMDWGLARTRSRRTEPRSASELRESSLVAQPPAIEGDASLSCVLTDRADPRGADVPALQTSEGDIVGTPSYMSPEQAAGRLEDIDARADVYSAGAMLYELLARRAPYVRTDSSPSSAEVLQQLRAGPPEPLASLAPQAPAELLAIASKAMAREPERRYAGMKEIAGDLRAFLEGRVVRAHRTGAWIEARKWIGRHRAVVTVLGMLLATVLAAGVVFAVLYQQAEQRRERLQVAQVDAQRRINAMKGFAAAGAPSHGFYEDFDGERLHRRWIATGRHDLVALRDGALVLGSAGAAQIGTHVGLDPHISVLRGEFDLRVRFRLVNFEVPATPRGGRIFSLMIWGLQSRRHLVAITREAEQDHVPAAHAAQSYRCFHEATKDGVLPEHCVASDDREGALRVQRKDDQIAAYFEREGGWVELFRVPSAEEPATFEVYVRNWYATEPFECHVDSIELIVDPSPRPAVASALDVSFEDPELDPRFVVSLQAGLVAPLGGRLFLETFAGVEGRVSFHLDTTRWCLPGDFALELEYVLDEFEAPDSGTSRWLIQAIAGNGEPMGELIFEVGPEGRCLRGFSFREERRRAAFAERGRVRIERRGSDLRIGLQEPGGWAWLLERQHVSPSVHFGFALVAESPADSPGVVVEVEALRLESLAPR